MLGDSGKIITTGIYRYTRNPIYCQWRREDARFTAF
jgi:protein-S-isoprenylcysteine O-methyltransferase Ste14